MQQKPTEICNVTVTVPGADGGEFVYKTPFFDGSLGIVVERDELTITRDGKEVARARVPGSALVDGTIDEGTERIATRSVDGSVRLWDAKGNLLGDAGGLRRRRVGRLHAGGSLRGHVRGCLTGRVGL